MLSNLDTDILRLTDMWKEIMVTTCLPGERDPMTTHMTRDTVLRAERKDNTEQGNSRYILVGVQREGGEGRRGAIQQQIPLDSM
jgi:hypothetical protein